MITTKKAPFLFTAQGYKLNPGDRAMVTTPRSPNVRKGAEFLGRGRFTSAYRVSNDIVYLYVSHGDHSKDMLSQAAHLFDNEHLPKMNHLGSMFDRTVQVYETGYYMCDPELESLTPQGQRDMVGLQKAHKAASERYKGNLIRDKMCGTFNEYIRDHAKVSNGMREAIAHLCEVTQYWGDYYLFDNFRSANMGVDDMGLLVLVDPMFDCKMLNEYKKAQAKLKKQKEKAR